MAKRIAKLLIFFVPILVVYTIWLDTIPLWSSDEGRYGEIAREMWEIKDFILPQFNYVDYLEKPVLAPLVTCLAYALFGVSHLSTRLPTLLFAFLGIFICYRFSRRFFSRRTANYAALVLATSPMYFILSRFAIIDMMMAVLMSTSLLCLLTAFLEEKRKYYLYAYALMGLTFLTKGLIAIVLPMLILICFLLWTGHIRRLKGAALGWGLLIVGLITIPWLIVVSIREPEYINEFIVKHHFVRFTSGHFGKHRPFWFYLPILFGGSFPWTLFLPAAVVDGLKSANARNRLTFQFLITWIAVVLVFFSIPGTKLPYYMLPARIALAMLIGALLDRWTDANRERKSGALHRWTWGALPAVFVFAFVGANIYLFFLAKDALTVKAYTVHIRVMTLVVTIGALLTYMLVKRDKIKFAVWSLAGWVGIALFFIAFIWKVITPLQSTYAYAEWLKPVLTEDDSVAIFSSPDHFADFPFHLRRRVIVVANDRGTLDRESREPGLKEEAKSWFYTPEEFARLFNAKEKRIFCLMDDDQLGPLTASGLRDVYTVKKGDGKLLITNREISNTL